MESGKLYNIFMIHLEDSIANAPNQTSKISSSLKTQEIGKNFIGLVVAVSNALESFVWPPKIAEMLCLLIIGLLTYI